MSGFEIYILGFIVSMVMCFVINRVHIDDDIGKFTILESLVASSTSWLWVLSSILIVSYLKLSKTKMIIKFVDWFEGN